MFKTTYTFWLKNSNNLTLKSRLNSWSIADIRSFNVLSSSSLSYIITSLNKPKVNVIKTSRSSKSLDYFITYILYLLVISTLLLKLFV